jgi:hypothetical protein
MNAIVGERLPRDDELLHLGGAFVDAQGADLAVELLDGMPADHAEAAPDLHGRMSMTCCAVSVAVILAMAASRVTFAPGRAARRRGR